MQDFQHLYALLLELLEGDEAATVILADFLEETGEADLAAQARLIHGEPGALVFTIRQLPYGEALQLACDACERVFRPRQGRKVDDVPPFYTIRQWLARRVPDPEMNRACRVLSNNRLMSEFTYVMSTEQLECSKKLAAATRSAFLVVHHERNFAGESRSGKRKEYTSMVCDDAAEVCILARAAATQPLEPRRWLWRSSPTAVSSNEIELHWQKRAVLSILHRLISRESARPQREDA